MDGGGGRAGLALTDFGESETANLASATVMADQRTRFLKTRQVILATCWRGWVWRAITGPCGWAGCGVSKRAE